MGRNEIRLRRQMMNSGRIARHRNYGELMARHEHDQRMRRVTRVVIYFLLIAFLIVLFVMVTRWSGRQQGDQEPTNTSTAVASQQSTGFSLQSPVNSRQLKLNDDIIVKTSQFTEL